MYAVVEQKKGTTRRQEARTPSYSGTDFKFTFSFIYLLLLLCIFKFISMGYIQ